MELKDQVVSLELAKRLKALGVKQESLFYWLRPIGDNGKPNGKYFLNWEDSNDFCDDDSHDHKQISAFSVAELGEMLDYATEYGRIVLGWYCVVDTKDIDEESRLGIKITNAKTEADARAKMLIYLIENKLVPAIKS